MLYYSFLCLSIAIFYTAILLVLRGGLLNLEKGINKNQPKVSIIVAVRNEERKIKNCLTAILEQRYPKSKLEILVIDDRSEDGTAEIVTNLMKKHSQIILLQINDTSSHLAPKKRAINLGIQHATGEIIVTTDADCQPGPLWISEMIKYFDSDVGLVIGYNPYKIDKSKSPLLQQILSLDYFAMACVAVASTGLEYPISCSGGNLAYRKEVYKQIGGFRKFGSWVSGDDDFFLEQVRQKTSWKVRYAANSKTFVPTDPPENFKAFFHQRIRYASKCGHYEPPITLTLFGVYLLNFLLLLGLFISPFAPQFLTIWVVAFISKILAEYLFLRRGQILFKSNHDVSVFLLTALLHPPYIVLVGLLGQFMRFNWKGENYSAKIKAPPPKPGQLLW